MTPYLIGLTGTISSGKSTAAACFLKLGALVVSGDELGKKALEQSPELLQAIHDRYGNEVFDTTGLLNRRALGRIVFADRQSIDWLTAATFPDIYAMWRECVRTATHPVVVLDAALIFEWGIENEFDLIVLMIASPIVVESRLTLASLTQQELQARMAMQLPFYVKQSKAHVVIQNDGSHQELTNQVFQLWQSTVLPQINLRSS
jgi:dephospho-CoA kinase